MEEKNVQRVTQVLDNMEQVIVGKRDVLELAFVTFLAGGNLLLEDVPGVGKTTLAKALAQTVGCDFNRIQFTPDTLPSDVLGVSIYSMKEETFSYVPGAVMSQIVLADEINRTSPKTQAALLEAMEEKQVTVDGQTHRLPSPFMLIATQNPIDYLGTYHLPEAQLDRFMMKLSMGYPKHQEELTMIEKFLGEKPWKDIPSVVSAEEILQMQREVKQVHIKKDLIEYALRIIECTREDGAIRLGASPRATLALISGAKSAAYVAGRDYVIPDDIKRVTSPILAHRLVLTPEAKAGKVNAEKLIAAILAKVHVPIV